MPRAVYLDVDNTLLDNDAAKRAMEGGIARLVAPDRSVLFWELYEAVRHDEDYVDFPTTLGRFRAALPDAPCADEIQRFLDLFPYRDFVYPGAFQAIARLRATAIPVVLSDGDAVFQPRKIARAGLAAAVDGQVFVYVHKEAHLGELGRRFADGRPVFVDDKAAILGHIKRALGPGAATLHVRQGKYAVLPPDPGDPEPDGSIDRIAEVDAAVARL